MKTFAGFQALWTGRLALGTLGHFPLPATSVALNATASASQKEMDVDWQGQEGAPLGLHEAAGVSSAPLSVQSRTGFTHLGKTSGRVDKTEANRVLLSLSGLGELCSKSCNKHLQALP